MDILYKFVPNNYTTEENCKSNNVLTASQNEYVLFTIQALFMI